jgi:hypothetical protein
VSSGLKVVAVESKARYGRPRRSMERPRRWPSSRPRRSRGSRATLCSRPGPVRTLRRGRRPASGVKLYGPAKATWPPSPEMSASTEPEIPFAPSAPLARLTSAIVLATTSRVVMVIIDSTPWSTTAEACSICSRASPSRPCAPAMSAITNRVIGDIRCWPTSSASARDSVASAYAARQWPRKNSAKERPASA